MVRAPCCEKMGLKKGPWTPKEDQILISYIRKNGHGNWRALPKHAGLLRCGKSCRLRWTNYLRPDIKRGNFSEEEEEAIIKLHEMLGNRWSAIAARLPGRTDNEIKNVWHTHLKKKLNNHPTSHEIKRQSVNVPKCESKAPFVPENEKSNCDANSPERSPQSSSSELSSVTADSSAENNGMNDNVVIKHEEMESSEYFPQIDESFWSEELSADNSNMESEIQLQFPSSPMAASEELVVNACSTKLDDGLDFWFNLFTKAGDLPEF